MPPPKLVDARDHLCIVLCVATKTISLDLEAYDHLRRAKLSEKESFSQVIKRAVWPPGKGTAGQLLAIFGDNPSHPSGLSESALDELDEWQRADSVAPDHWAERR